MTYSEAPVSVNFRPAVGFDAPQLTLRGENAYEAKANVEGAAASGLFEAIATADAAYKTAYSNAPSAGAVNAQNVLGATPVATVPVAAPAAPAPASADPWAAPAPAWGAPAGAPAAPAYTAAPAPGAPGYVPAPAAAPAPAGAGSAGAPFIPAFGMSATFRSGQGARGPWSAYFDPRPKQVTDMIPVDHTGKVPSTDNVNHPGLAGGTHKFSQFIR